MAIPFISTLNWLAENFTLRSIADAVDISTRAVSYWRTGETIPTLSHQYSLERLFESGQYQVMRGYGLAPEASAKYRGLYPDTFDIWADRLNEIENKFAGGHVEARLRREGLDIDTLTDREYQAIWEEEYDRLLDDIEESGDDVEQLEESP